MVVLVDIQEVCRRVLLSGKAAVGAGESSKRLRSVT